MVVYLHFAISSLVTICHYLLFLFITIQDASKSIEEVHQELVSIVTTTIERVQTESSPLQRMWADGEYELPEPNDEKKEED